MWFRHQALDPVDVMPRLGRHVGPDGMPGFRLLVHLPECLVDTAITRVIAAKGKVKIVAVKADDNSTAVSPSEQTVKSGQYSIARSLYLYINGEATGTVKSFVEFCLSDRGQKITVETGYVGI